MSQVRDVFDTFRPLLAPLGAIVVAGGAVRDELMCREPKDFDVFVLGAGFTKANRELALTKLAELPTVAQLEFHKSEPFLIETVRWRESVVQVMCSPHQTVDELLDNFDWNISRFAFDGSTHQREDIGNIAAGKPLVLHKVTYPLSTLRRGFRFSERFSMVLEKTDIVRLCREIVAAAEVSDQQKARVA